MKKQNNDVFCPPKHINFLPLLRYYADSNGTHGLLGLDLKQNMLHVFCGQSMSLLSYFYPILNFETDLDFKLHYTGT